MKEKKDGKYALAGIDPAQAARLRRAVRRLHRWYGAHARQLPWRETRDPYAIWVSEVMLQQTQVATVLSYYARWMERLPTLEALAHADESEVLLLWEGLGYYSRARNFLAAAKRVWHEHRGVVPRDPASLQALPGVGPYTAAAVSSLAFDVPAAVVDGNVRRVLARLVALDRPPGRATKAVDALARALLPTRKAALHNQAVMELGALVCTPRAPRCDACPVAAACEARAMGDPQRYPLREPRREVPHHHLAVAIVEHRGRLLLYQRPYDGMLAGLWDLPTVRVEADACEGERAAVLSRMLQHDYGVSVRLDAPLATVRHAYTHLKITLWPHRCRVRGRLGGATRAAEAQTVRWLDAAQMEHHAMTRASQKVLALLD